MKLFNIALTTCLLAASSFVFAPSAQADEWNRKTKVTFSGPVEIPGVHQKGSAILPAGTYIFKILDNQSDRHVVQIFSEDENMIHATILAIPNYRLKVTGKTVITFAERPAGQPEAIRAWFYPGREYGEEFVYPKAQAATLAKATNNNVLYSQDEIRSEEPSTVAAAKTPAVEEMRRTEIRAVQPSGEETQFAQVVTPPPAETPARVEVAQATPPPAPAAEVAQPTLPATASSLPMFSLFGVLALLGGFGLAKIEKATR